MNSARTASQQLLDNASQRIRPRESIEGSDRSDPALIAINRELSEQLERDIQKLSRSDPNYA